MDYRELVFYQKARQVVRGINDEIRTWPKGFQAQEISRQLFRAATSIGANIAEGHGRHKGQEYIHFLIIAQGSANEVDHWLNTALDCKIGDLENIKKILTINTEIRKMLSTAIFSLRSQASKAVHETPAPYSPSPLHEDDIDQGQEIP